MEYHEITNFLDKKPNKPSKFRTKIGVKRNDGTHGTSNIYSQIKLKNATLESSLCDYSGSYIFVKSTVSVTNMAAVGGAANNGDKKVIFKSCAPFTDCIREIHNRKLDNAKNVDAVMPMYNVEIYGNNIEMNHL